MNERDEFPQFFLDFYIILVIIFYLIASFWFIPIISGFSFWGGLSFLLGVIAVGVFLTVKGVGKDGYIQSIVMSITGIITVLVAFVVIICAIFSASVERNNFKNEEELFDEVNNNVNYFIDLEDSTLDEEQFKLLKRKSLFKTDRGLLVSLNSEKELNDYITDFKKLQSFCHTNSMSCYVTFSEGDTIYHINRIKEQTIKQQSLLVKEDLKKELRLADGANPVPNSSIEVSPMERKESPLLIKELKEAGFELLYDKKALSKKNENVIHILVGENYESDFYDNGQNIVLLNILKNYIVDYKIRLKLMSSEKNTVMNLSDSDLKNEIFIMEKQQKRTEIKFSLSFFVYSRVLHIIICHLNHFGV